MVQIKVAVSPSVTVTFVGLGRNWGLIIPETEKKAFVFFLQVKDDH